MEDLLRAGDAVELPVSLTNYLTFVSRMREIFHAAGEEEELKAKIIKRLVERVRSAARDLPHLF